MRRKSLLEEGILFENNLVRVSKESNGDLFFEIGNEITTDISEAVAILMQKDSHNSEIWNFNVQGLDSVDPERSLYWLTGGHKEWRSLENYSRPWSACHLDFQEEFGILIFNIVKRSKKLKDIKEEFNRYLNLPNLYEFALSKKLIK